MLTKQDVLTVKAIVGSMGYSEVECLPLARRIYEVIYKEL